MAVTELGQKSAFAWAPAAAVAAAALAFAGMMIPSAGFSVTDDLPAAAMIEKIESASTSLLIGGGIQGLAAMAMVVYGAVIRRSLRTREASGSLTPSVAWGGAVLTAGMAAMAAAHTQVATGWDNAVDAAVPLTLYTLAENLSAGAWCSVALIAGAVAVAGLKNGAVPRWLGGISAFVAVLLVLAQLVVPWAAWFPAMVWLAVSAVALRSPTS